MNQLAKKQILQRHINLLSNRDIWTEAPKQTSRSHKNEGNARPAVANKRRVDTNYDILGVSPKASQKEIKSAYYSLSKTCHPDVNNTNEAAVQFREITDAYDVLSNEESKRVYDMTIGNNHYRRNNFNDSAEVNQQNLDRYQDFARFRRNKFTDSEDFVNQRWKKRRDMTQEQKYRDNSEAENKKRYRYVDPLKYDPKTYYKEHFNEEMQKRYAEEIDKREERFQKAVEEWRSEISIKYIIIVLIMVIPLALHLIANSPEFGLTSNDNNKSDYKLITKSKSNSDK